MHGLCLSVVEFSMIASVVEFSMIAGESIVTIGPILMGAII